MTRPLTHRCGVCKASFSSYERAAEHQKCECRVGRIEGILHDRGGRTAGIDPVGAQAPGRERVEDRARPVAGPVLTRDEDVSDNRAMYVPPDPHELAEVREKLRRRNRYAAGFVAPPVPADLTPPSPEARAAAKEKIAEARKALDRAKHPGGDPTHGR